MHWIFLSPHLDDSVLSCGGFIYERVQLGDQVEIWTICAGNPPKGALTPFAHSLHRRWKTTRNAPSIRRAEDISACKRIGAVPRHFNVPDCIYRKNPVTGEPIIQEDEDIQQPLGESQAALILKLKKKLAAVLPAEARVVSPLAIGNHIDHQLTRRAADGLQIPLWYLIDYPYITFDEFDATAWVNPEWEEFSQPVSRSGLKAWQSAISEYHSQISTFWNSTEEMEKAMESYWKSGGGCKIWKKNQPGLITIL